jgi:hypothetical protein
MLDVFNTSPANTNYQEFYGGGTTQDWTKPRGASMVRFMLIGAGGAGAFGGSTVGGGGGGSGAVTSWIGPAIFIPDVLRISVGATGVQSTVLYQQKDGTGYTLLTANAGSAGSGTTGGAGGTATTANAFAASGIYTSIAGQAGTAGSTTGGGTNQTASTTTFLSGGAGGAGGSGGTGGGVTPNYGYPALPPTTAGGTVIGANGYFITQPILVGCGGAGGTTSVGTGTNGGNGGIGCGGGGDGEDNTGPAYGRRGGDGAVFIWAW